MTHLPELQDVYESLIDERSRETFCGYWLGRISNQFAHFVHTYESHHLIGGFIPPRGGTVIEAGAYDGGTATIFTELGYKVYTFEMDKINFAATEPVAAEKNFVLENFGLGAYKHTEHYNPTGQNWTKLGGGEETAQITTIDAYVREKGLERVDYIRLDVEGAELDVLRGAAMTIGMFKPILNISAYHKPDDFWTLMNFVKSIRPDYEFALRHSFDTPEHAPRDFPDKWKNFLLALGLEPDSRRQAECVLFAR